MPVFQKIIVASFLLFSTFLAEAQQKDTVRVMTYNLMFYRQTTSFCTSSNNSSSLKDNSMEDIFDYTLPDIFVVQEIGGGSPVNGFRLLQNAINQNGRTNYNLANATGLTQSLVNMLYYNTDKFVLESQSLYDKDLSNQNFVRIIDEYVLRYKDTNLASHMDTTRIHVLSAHLKAGNSPADELERSEATESVMASLDSLNATGNYLFAGDFNLYRSSEPAYQDLTNYVDPTLRFFDPISVPGNWSNSAVRAFTHTQSTRTSGGCFAGGGMDDRFDFILASDEVMNNTDKMRYIPNTYQALGQDGNRFNGSIISPTNNSVPTLISQALHNLSDHLPVMMDIEINLPTGPLLIQEQTGIGKLKFQNPNEGNLLIDLSNQTGQLKLMQILDVTGKIILEKNLNSERYVQFDISNFSEGSYFIRVESSSYQQTVEKLIKI